MMTSLFQPSLQSSDTVSLLPPSQSARRNRSDSYPYDTKTAGGCNVMQYAATTTTTTPTKKPTQKQQPYTPPTPPLTPSPVKEHHQQQQQMTKAIKTQSARTTNESIWSDDDDDDDDDSLLQDSTVATSRTQVDPPGLCFPAPRRRLQYLDESARRLMTCGGCADSNNDSATAADYTSKTLQDEPYVALGCPDASSPSMVQSFMTMVDTACSEPEKARLLSKVQAAMTGTKTANDNDDDSGGDYILSHHWTLCKPKTETTASANDNNRASASEEGFESPFVPDDTLTLATDAMPGQLDMTSVVAASSLFSNQDQGAATAKDATAEPTEPSYFQDLSDESLDDEMEELEATLLLEAESKRNAAPSFCEDDDDDDDDDDNALNRCLIPCHTATTTGDATLKSEQQQPGESPKAAVTTATESPAAILENFEMILEDSAPAPKRRTFWPFRRGRMLSRRLRDPTKSRANLNVVATESCSAEEEGDDSASMELPAAATSSTEYSVDNDNELEDDERFLPPLQAVSGKLLVFDNHMNDDVAEEEKKEDDMDASMLHATPATASSRLRKANKEARYKSLLGGLLSNHRLAPVDEEKPVVADSDIYVRVPGLENPDKFLSSDDLIGEEYISFDRTWLPDIIEEGSLYSEDDESGSTIVDANNTRVESTGTTTEDSSVLQKSLATKTANGKTEEPVPVVKQNRFWMLSCQSQNVIKAVLTEEDCKYVTPDPSGSASVIANHPAEKPVWKEALCQSSGRTYWYHRETRETTWTKPPEKEIIQGKAKKIESCQFETVTEETKEVFPDKANINDHAHVMPVLSSKTTKKEEQPEPLASEYERKVWAVKDDIVAILKSMAPTEGQNVGGLLAQYDGQEEKLLSQLLNNSERKPFDEPLEKESKSSMQIKPHREKPPLASKPAEQPAFISTQQASVLPSPFPIVNRVQTHMTHASVRSNRTESTIQIKNTYKPNRKQRIDFETGSISSARQQLLQQRSHDSDRLENEMSANPVLLPGKIPSKVPVPRSRELVVEEFNTKRYKAEVFDVKAGLSTPRKPFGSLLTSPRSPSPAMALASDGASTPVNYLGDTEDNDIHDANSIHNDSISALSDVDYMLDHKAPPSPLAARKDVLSNVKGVVDTSKAAFDGTAKKSEWAQTELDRFISVNDWDAVASYIARVRIDPDPSPPKVVTTKATTIQQEHSRKGLVTPQRNASPRHEQVHSMESWEESGSFTSYDSEDYSASMGTMTSSENESLPRRGGVTAKSSRRRR